MGWKSMPMLMYTVLSETYTCCKRSGLDIDHAVCVNAADEERNRFQIYHDGIGNITTVKENDVLKLSHTY